MYNFLHINLCDYLSYLLLFVLVFNVHAQLSKTHYIPITYPSVSSGNTDNQSEEVKGQYLYISTPSSTLVNVDVRFNGNIIDSRSIDNTSHWEFDTSFVSDKDDINSSYVMEHPYNSLSNKGLIVEASSPVFVSLQKWRCSSY